MIWLCPLANARGCSLKGHGNKHTHTHTHVSRAMSIMLYHVQVLSEAAKGCFVVVKLFWDHMRSASRAQAGGSVAQVLMLSNPETNPSNTAQKPTPWANPIPPNPRTWKRDFQVIAQATDCLGLREPPRVVARGMGWALPVRVIVWNSLYTSRNYYKPAGTIYRLVGAIL